MSDLVGTFRSYALDKDNCPRMDSEVVYVRVALLKEAADRIEALEADLRETDEEFAILSTDLGKALSRVEVLEAENARLREALLVIYKSGLFSQNGAYKYGFYSHFKTARIALGIPHMSFDEARAACLAMLRAWPGAIHNGHWLLFPHTKIPLPTENSNVEV